MASTITLQTVVNYAQNCIRNAPLTGIGGNANEPAMSIGDWVRMFILNPPFSWRWNRTIVSVPLVQGQQDTLITQPQFGYLEKASWFESVSNKSKELQVALILSTDTQENAPVSCAINLDDDSGDITVRVLPVPDLSTYTLTLQYQNSPPSFGSLSDTWAPIPDYLYGLIQTGFLAKTYEYLNDERFATTMSLFVKQVIAANAGLADSQTNIFMAEFVNSQRELAAELGNSQSGRVGRGLFG